MVLSDICMHFYKYSLFYLVSRGRVKNETYVIIIAKSQSYRMFQDLGSELDRVLGSVL